MKRKGKVDVAMDDASKMNNYAYRDSPIGDMSVSNGAILCVNLSDFGCVHTMFRKMGKGMLSMLFIFVNTSHDGDG